MKNTGLKNEEQLRQIIVSGSSSLKKKNPAGIHLFEESDLSDGIISGRLSKPKYNDTELLKSIDTVIEELVPQSTPTLPDTVLRTVYNEAIQQITTLTTENESLQTQVSNLTSKVSNLELINQNLLIDIDNQKLTADAASDRAEEANKQVASSTIDLSNSIQNSINEAIERVSLTARNESLSRENELLKDQLFGKAARASEGAQTGEDFAVRVLQIEDTTKPNALIYRQRANGTGKKWINGPKIEISNFTSEDIVVSFSRNDTEMVSMPPNRTIPANDKIEISFNNKRNDSWISGRKPKNGFGFTGDKTYSGTMSVKSLTSNSIIEVGIILQKQRGSNWG